ncbi:MAG: hypothetical protein D6812_04820 [Deltaproteobacteria bacterium]|nr:MAG: hypothetical protein D6812_04820 [Deltaproteobacteria bacterium]
MHKQYDPQGWALEDLNKARDEALMVRNARVRGEIIAACDLLIETVGVTDERSWYLLELVAGVLKKISLRVSEMESEYERSIQELRERIR